MCQGCEAGEQSFLEYIVKNFGYGCIAVPFDSLFRFTARMGFAKVQSRLRIYRGNDAPEIFLTLLSDHGSHNRPPLLV
jgi:hypothetical protein